MSYLALKDVIDDLSACLIDVFTAHQTACLLQGRGGVPSRAWLGSFSPSIIAQVAGIPPPPRAQCGQKNPSGNIEQ